MTTENYIGIIAGALTAISLLPQLITTIKKKKAEDVSVMMLVVLFSGLCGWVVYGWMKKDYPIIITNSFSVLVNGALLFLRIKYKKRGA